MMSALNITSEQDFSERVLKSQKTVLVDFFATWCGPCKMAGPEVEAVGVAMADKASVVQVNIDEQPGLASRYNVKAVPTFLVIKGGQEVNRFTGFRTRKDLQAAIEAAQ